MLVFNTLIY